MDATAKRQDSRTEQIPAVTVSAKASPHPVEKSYRKMLKGMDRFERQHGISPSATLRFKLLPCKRGPTCANITLAMEEDAQVVPTCKQLTMGWRTDIRTLG